MTSTINEIPDHMKMGPNPDEAPPEGWGMFSIPDPSGDSRIMWNPRDKADVEFAKAAFEDARRKGMAIYLADPQSGESTGEVVTEFPKKEGKLIAVKPIAGG